MSVILDVAQTIKQFVLRRSINEVALHVLGAPAHFDDVLLAGFLALAFGCVAPSQKLYPVAVLCSKQSQLRVQPQNNEHEYALH